MTAQPPLVTRRVLEALLRLELPAEPTRRLVLIHGRYAAGEPDQFTLKVAEDKRRVEVVEQHSVLGLSDAWHRHQSENKDGDQGALLVVATGVADGQLGWDLRGHALRRQVLNVDHAEIVKLRFGAVDLDPRVRAQPWLVNALLQAEPSAGWPRAGSVLTLDTAMRSLIEARLSVSGTGSSDPSTRRGRDAALWDTPLDADTLLSWSHGPGGPARYAALSAEEQQGISAWLAKAVGESAPLLLQLCAAARSHEAMALGVVGAVLAGPAMSAETGLALGGLFGAVRPKSSELQAFTAAVEGTLTRWLVQAEQTGPQQSGLQQHLVRDRALQVLQQADRIAADAGLAHALADSPYLPSGFQTRLASLASALAPTRGRPAGDPDAAANALGALRQHHLGRFYATRVRTAEAAVRLVRWLAEPEPAPGSVAAAVHGHLADWGWVDAALNVLWEGDPEAPPTVGAAYEQLYRTARSRRTALDQAFARHLREWTRTAATQAPGGALLVEDVLARIVVPLAMKDRPAPLVLLLDGMSSAVAVGFGEELRSRGWLEASPTARTRTAAVAAIPSLTRISRASLLTGALISGGQSVEKPGFASFWKNRQGRSGVLFHKADIGGPAGQRLADTLQRELAGESVVAVVLNTVDDSLDHAAQGDRTGWRLTDVTYLEELLAAARLYGRPVVLVADHGHVLERGEGDGAPAGVEGVGAARWRTGEPGDGEIVLAGPRVLEGGGRIVAPWREDIRYTPRKAGYHGGASLAEMTVPVLVVLPAEESLPKGWSLVAPEDVTPRWWSGAPGAGTDTGTPGVALSAPAESPRAKGGKARKLLREPAAEALFAVDTVAPEAAAVPRSLGERLVASDVFTSQKQYVRRAPDAAAVAAVVDAFVAADWVLSLTAAATAAGRAGRNVDGFAAMLQRLLNVESYPVLEFIDNGTRLRLNVSLAREQFQVEG